MKTIQSLLPWTAVLALLAGAIWWLLARDVASGRWLLAAVLFGHGAVHILFATPAPQPTGSESTWPFDMTRSWMSTGPGLDTGTVRALGLALIAVTVAGFAVAALSTVPIAIPAGWWQAVIGVSAASSTILLLIFFTPQLSLGIAINGTIGWIAASAAWLP